MEFGHGQGNFTPMDREYEKAAPAPTNKEIGFDVKDIGMSLALGPVPNVHAVGSKMRAGMKTVELGFMGVQKGSGQSQTPEYYGKLQRQALSEMQKANEYNFTTHATVGIAGLAGMGEGGSFSKHMQNVFVSEIKRAIDFAADVSKGGPVVVHTGEVQRPFFEAEWNKDGPYKDKFKQYHEEEKQARFIVIDDRTGQGLEEARMSKFLSRPVYKRYDKETSPELWEKHKGNRYFDESAQKWVEPNKTFLDYNNSPIERAERKPVYDAKTGEFKLTKLNWEEIHKEAQEMTEDARREWQLWKEGKLSKEQQEKSYWRHRFFNERVKSEKDIAIKPEEAYLIAKLETNAATNRSWAEQAGQVDFEEYLKEKQKLEKAMKLYKQMEENAKDDPEALERLKIHRKENDLVPDVEGQLPSEYLDRQLRRINAQILRAQEGASSQLAQAEDNIETIRHVRSANDYAVEQAFEGYAMAGMRAWLQSDKLQQEGKLKDNLAVAMENLFPEQYGAHPDELIKLVKGSREAMARMLIQEKQAAGKPISEEEAQKVAHNHIYATLDTGHLNMWRKYWQNDPKKTMGQNDDDFDDWIKDKMQQMVKNDVIGHIHLVDNYGYQDDHLAPGEGNTPVKGILKVLKDANFKGKLIVEPGADWTVDSGGFASVAKTWRHLGLSIHGKGAGTGLGAGGAGASYMAPRQWEDVQYGWMGEQRPPYFTFGGYSPSEDWKFWSDVPLE